MKKLAGSDNFIARARLNRADAMGVCGATGGEENQSERKSENVPRRRPKEFCHNKLQTSRAIVIRFSE
jgi:hypothetical protein